MATPKAAWSWLLTGRAPTQTETNDFCHAFSQAAAYLEGRALVELRKALFRGHGCGLGLVAAQALLRSSATGPSVVATPVRRSQTQIQALGVVPLAIRNGSS